MLVSNFLSSLGLASSLAAAAPLRLRSGAPINNMTVSVGGTLCQNQHVNISWTDTEFDASPYSLQIGLGGYYTGVKWTQRYDNITNMWYDWVVNEMAGSSLVFQVSDSVKERTYIQNLVVKAASACGPEMNNVTEVVVSMTESGTESVSATSSLTILSTLAEVMTVSDASSLEPSASVQEAPTPASSLSTSSDSPISLFITPFNTIPTRKAYEKQRAPDQSDF
ncbi:uncharacterized protein L203_101923 [Cryptococcus depauperatus CBS 7841]|uniref:Uncharacterized protein n=1 Tax=Cryptococcus depauperatus CBS 7841 TaxID=1295531 RepID=A0A1E3IH98_9TREE|nr:hypothetical protein L203_03166 [Cryptococcus depauperatus CBS 7841]